MNYEQEINKLRTVNMKLRHKLTKKEEKCRICKGEREKLFFDNEHLVKKDCENREFILRQEKEIRRLHYVLRYLEESFNFKIVYKGKSAFHVEVDGYGKTRATKYFEGDVARCNRHGRREFKEQTEDIEEATKGDPSGNPTEDRVLTEIDMPDGRMFEEEIVNSRAGANGPTDKLKGEKKNSKAGKTGGVSSRMSATDKKESYRTKNEQKLDNSDKVLASKSGKYGGEFSRSPKNKAGNRVFAVDSPKESKIRSTKQTKKTEYSKVNINSDPSARPRASQPSKQIANLESHETPGEMAQSRSRALEHYKENNNYRSEQNLFEQNEQLDNFEFDETPGEIEENKSRAPKHHKESNNPQAHLSKRNKQEINLESDENPEDLNFSKPPKTQAKTKIEMPGLSGLSNINNSAKHSSKASPHQAPKQESGRVRKVETSQSKETSLIPSDSDDFTITYNMEPSNRKSNYKQSNRKNTGDSRPQSNRMEAKNSKTAGRSVLVQSVRLEDRVNSEPNDKGFSASVINGKVIATRVYYEDVNNAEKVEFNAAQARLDSKYAQSLKPHSKSNQMSPVHAKPALRKKMTLHKGELIELNPGTAEFTIHVPEEVEDRSEIDMFDGFI